MLTPEQQAARLEGIGASECASVLGLNPWQSPYELWLEKTGQVQPDDLSNNFAVRMGNLLEPVVAEVYEYKTGERVRKVNTTLHHKDYPHILCHLDRKVQGKRKVLEIKTANPYSNDWGEEGTDQIPLNYLCQVQHQLAVTGYEVADLIVYRGTTDLRIYPINRDESIINELVKRLDAFWNNHVLTKIAPEMTIRRDVEAAFPANNGSYIDASQEAIKLYKELRDIRKAAKDIEADKSAIESALLKLVGDADGIKVGDDILLTWKASKTGKRVLRINERSSL